MKILQEVGFYLIIYLVTFCAITSISAFSPSIHRRPFDEAVRRSGQHGASFLPPGACSDSRSSVRIWAKDDDDDDEDDNELGLEEDEPLSKGIDSVSWLPSTVGASKVESTEGSSGGAPEGAEVLPLFPLGGIVYTPNSEHVLNIFEPRYRQMYSDILMNGSKKFVVSMSHPTEPGRFAQTGVLFELEDLKEVSEQTADRIKFICSHKVTGRVKLHRVLNPEAWEKRDTYLRVEGTVADDSGKKKDVVPNDVYGALAEGAEGNPKEEKALQASFAELVELQHDLEEDVRFTRASAASLAVKPGPGQEGLWQTIRLWQSFIEQRLMARQNELQREFQEKLQDFLKKERGLKEEELPSAIGYQDLSPSLQKELQELQKRVAVELQPLVLESTLTMQKILEAPDHTARLKLVRYFMDAESKRLYTKKTLKGMFAGTTTTAYDSSMPAEERTDDDDKDSAKKSLAPKSESKNEDSTTSSSSFFDDDDAFQ